MPRKKSLVKYKYITVGFVPKFAQAIKKAAWRAELPLSEWVRQACFAKLKSKKKSQ